MIKDTKSILKPKSRRQFLKSILPLIGKVSAVGVLLIAYLKSTKHRISTAIRPPGALSEAEFLSACVKCGLCVQACPYDILKLATLDEPVPTGTPFFIARDNPCEMCIDIPCIKACPTEALDHSLTNINEAEMGLAAFINPETCFAVQGTACRACHMVCPIKDTAITMTQMRDKDKIFFQPTVNSSFCTGCGKCEEACLSTEASIKVLPRALLTTDSAMKIHG